jgi:hypothetical protein
MNAPQLECFECVAAAAGMHHGSRFGCSGCDARTVARSLPFAQARADGRLTSDYLALLEATGITHEQAKAAHAADAFHHDGRHVPTDAVQTLADSA